MSAETNTAAAIPTAVLDRYASGRFERLDQHERFWSKVWKTADCWIWLASKTQGYGQFTYPGGKYVRAHRFAYELLVGPIPEGMTLDHLCRNRACVNPDHLEVVTNRENVLRGEGRTAQEARQTHCKYGHEFTLANTYIDHRGNRDCRACIARRSREWRRRHRLALASRPSAEEEPDE